MALQTFQRGPRVEKGTLKNILASAQEANERLHTPTLHTARNPSHSGSQEKKRSGAPLSPPPRDRDHPPPLQHDEESRGIARPCLVADRRPHSRPDDAREAGPSEPVDLRR